MLSSNCMKMNSNIITFLLILISFLGGFYSHDNFSRENSLNESIDYSYLEKVLKHIKTNFVNQDNVDIQKMTEGAVSGMVNSLDDPYTEYFNLEGTKDLQESISGTFEGIGLQLGFKNERITAISPIKGTPAERSGIKPKDVILFVDGKETSSLSLNEVVNMIRGEKGTKVTLTVAREGLSTTKDFEIIRDIINVPALEWETIETSSGKIAHLIIYQFSDTVYQDFKEAANEILKSNIKGIVLDLRSNPGGLVNQAINIAGWFLEKGQMVLFEEDKDGIKKEFNSNGPSNFSSYPTVILIDEGSASASEILAGALKDNRELLMIGQKSYGKGTVQKIIDLGEGTSLKVTIAKWFTPLGNIIDGEGINPDILVEITLEDYEQEKDPQLEKALEEIEKIIK